MENIFGYLEKATGVKDLEKKNWVEVVDTVILPKLAGLPEHRYRIAPPFMAFMAKFGDICLHQDYQTGIILYEIALQRISDGAVVHNEDLTPTFAVLPQKYHAYASQSGYVGCEPGLMGQEEEEFLLNCLRDCASLSNLKSHALAICFGLAENITQDGQERNGYMLGSCYYHPNGKSLRALADDIIRELATPEQIFKHWAKPNRWHEHKLYFAKALKNETFEWNTFWEAVAPAKLNCWKKWIEKRKVRGELLRLAD